MGSGKIDWIIRPHEGVGPLNFGMSEADVAAILGPPDFVRAGSAGRKVLSTEFRDSGEGAHCVVIYGKNGVRELDFEKKAKTLALGSQKLFAGKRDKLIDMLIESTDTVFESFEGFVFPDLGLNMSNAANFRENSNICVFERGAFDDLIRDVIEDELGEFVKGGLA